MSYKGISIWDHPTGASGLQYSNPEYEWILTAQWAGETYAAFRNRPVEYQEMMIAAYRTQSRTEAVIAYANRPRR